MVVVNPLFLEKTAVRRRFVHLLPVEGHGAHELLLQLEPGHRVPGLPQGRPVFLVGPVNPPLKMAVGLIRTGEHHVQGALPPENGADDHQGAPGVQGGIDRRLHPVQDGLDDFGVAHVDVIFQVVQDHQIRPPLLVLQPPEALPPAPGLHPDVVQGDEIVHRLVGL